ncbi:MAG: hypothetical protein U0168_00055 [Nannocystaceae bacterium]
MGRQRLIVAARAVVCEREVDQGHADLGRVLAVDGDERLLDRLEHGGGEVVIAEVIDDRRECAAHAQYGGVALAQQWLEPLELELVALARALGIAAVVAQLGEVRAQREGQQPIRGAVGDARERVFEVRAPAAGRLL